MPIKTPPDTEVEAYVRTFLPLVDKERMNTILVVRKPGEGAVATLTACEDLAAVLVTVVGLLRNIEAICRQHEDEGGSPIADWFAGVCFDMEERLDIEHKSELHLSSDLTKMTH
jgi:hypothetical protein